MLIKTHIAAVSILVTSLTIPFTHAEVVTKEVPFKVIATGRTILKNVPGKKRKPSRLIGGNQVEAIDIEKFDSSKGTLTGITIRLRDYQALSSGRLRSQPRTLRRQAKLAMNQTFQAKSDLLQPQRPLFYSTINYPFRSEQLAARFPKNRFAYSNKPSIPTPNPNVITISDSTALNHVTGSGKFPIEIRATDVYQLRAPRRGRNRYSFSGQTSVTGTIQVEYQYTPR